MRNILLIAKNNLYRFTKEKVMMIMVIIVMPIIICLGVYFSSTNDIKGKIAVVGATIEEKEIIEANMNDNEKVKIEFMKNSPSKTDLIKGVYLAEINFDSDEPNVISYGKEEIRKTLEVGLNGEVYEKVDDRTTVQGKVIGFLIMFLFMGATTMIMDFFLSDRENGTYTRVLSGKISYFEYIGGQILYSIIILSISSTIWSVLILKVLNVNLDISYSLFMFLVLLVGILSSSLGMFIATIFKDRVSASMGGSIIVMITCLLGGCLVNIDNTNKVMGFIRNVLPQKRMIDLANNFNNGDLIFVICSILIFILISVILGKRQYENGTFK
ncbi:ABC transporter permease [Clostridium sp. LIBA-8841]|uniref:ABC transporter permease n=1 Tax=Clostridium sp. LIBA-8841 TaxID=2987530 RepID=UPI002AC61628|nr:ABC transporter permease [Clostridium sp. LIBA-8841]MDZ5254065.1 ABC transporter permease [Clostridium sp. LIBA-8841]